MTTRRKGSPMEKPLKVDAVLSAPNTDAHVVILKADESLLLPIWVGAPEGNAIKFAMEGIAPPRPLQHDLFRNLLGHLNVQVERVVISAVKGSTYFAELWLQADGKRIKIDSRPSDAIALALRVHAPIFAADEVLDAQRFEQLDSILEQFRPKDVGHYDA
jgi:bifunctional DNase/RNase